MKKLVILSLLLMTSALAANAQEIPKNAIGLRIGDNKGFGTEINYQRGLDQNTRLEFGLGWHSKSYYDAFKVTGLYQWVWNLEDKLNWYAGAGGGFGTINYDKGRYYYKSSSDSYVFIAGSIGMEYHLNIPLILSLDFRPEIAFGNDKDDLLFDIAVGVRYKF